MKSRYETIKLTVEHRTKLTSESERLRAEHPGESDVTAGGRLLGSLQPSWPSSS